MARLNHGNINAIFDAISVWKENCLLKEGSILSNAQLWTLKNFNELDVHFIQDYMEGSDRSFFEKLQEQLSDAKPEASKLAAEMLWFMFLFTDHIGYAKKVDNISQVWSWSGETLTTNNKLLKEPLDGGVGNPGPAYNTKRPWEFTFFIRLMQKIKNIDTAQRQDLLSDPWAMGSFVDEVPESDKRQFRHIFLYLVHPDYYERIATPNQKKKIVKVFINKVEESVVQRIEGEPVSTFIKIDKKLYEIRNRLTQEYPEVNLDFYHQPLKRIWKTGDSSENGTEENNAHVVSEPSSSFTPDSQSIYWIFQANPKYYDVERAIRALKIIAWEVNQSKNQIKKGDKVFIWKAGKQASIIALGTILNDPAVIEASEEERRFDVIEGRFDEAKLRVKVQVDQILDEPITRERLLDHPTLQHLGIIKFANATNFGVTDNEKLALIELIKESSVKTNPEYTLEQCASDTGISQEELKDWLIAIERKGQAILYGPPGTGKTYVAEHIAQHLVSGGDGNIDIVQFHPSYAYEDFVEGIRPVSDSDGNLSYPVKTGRFLDFCRRAAKTDSICVLIVDEINRANLSRVFGELMYLLEYRNREIKLASGTRFTVPGNIRMIGTMNTADRSIALVDYALRRRFAFLPLEPKYEILESFHAATGFNPQGLINVLKRLNRLINDKHYEVGIAFFLTNDIQKQIKAIWEMEIAPYLEEYFFDDQEKISNFRWDKIKNEVLS